MKRWCLFLFWIFPLFTSALLGQVQVFPVGKFIRFNGIDQYLKIPNDKDFNIGVGESYTITCRIRPDDFKGVYSILAKGDIISTESRYEIITINTSEAPNIALKLRNENGTNLGTPWLQKLSAGVWIHFAWVYNASEKSSKVFINGVTAGIVTNQAIGYRKIENTCDLTIGCGFSELGDPNRQQFWPGHMDELRIWKRELTNAEIISDLAASEADTGKLVASYDFEGIRGKWVNDRSGKQHNGILYGFDSKVVKCELPVSIGATNERLTAFRIIAGNADENIRSVSLNFESCTQIRDLTSVRVYYNGDNERLNPATAVLFGSSAVMATHITIEGNQPLCAGENYFWITADIGKKAHEGHEVGATVLSYTTDSGTLVKLADVPGKRIILLHHILLYSGGDGGSRHHRIPAMITARDGSLVVTNDRRWSNFFDLPGNIDVVSRRSVDKGLTWSDPVTIAGENTQTGFGDAALMLNRKTGELIALFASDKGFFASSASAPIRIYMSKSGDNGKSWSLPQDITSQIYGAECQNPQTRIWQAAFVTSGSSVQLRNGRLIAALTVRETFTRDLSNYVIYSDDHGKSWQVSPNRASVEGNEAKLVELDNGYLLMSIRTKGHRRFNISTDKGNTWGIPFEKPDIIDPSCNGDIIRYTCVADGFEKNRILHSIPWSSSRHNISVLMSYDEGITWPVRKTIYPGESAYSSLAILPDGTIGIFYEVGEYETYQLYFARFSLSWLSDGKDSWTPKTYYGILASEDILGSESGINLYPNPAEDFVNISGQIKPGSHIEIYNELGMLMSNIRIETSPDHVKIDLSRFVPGVYLVKIGSEFKRLIVK